MLSVLDLYNLERERNGLINSYNNQSIGIAGQRQNLLVNRDQQLSDQERQFRRLFETFGNVYSRRGLETSGIKAQGTDRVLGDQQRLQNRTRQGFARQNNNLLQQQFEVGRNYNQGISDVDAYRTAARQSTASQIRGIQGN